LSKQPRVTGDEAIRAFERAGWSVMRQKGSHVSLKKDGVPAILTVPGGRDDLATGTLSKLIRLSGLTVDQFRELL